jgi:endonuclease/exonuclease/phosphatase family metal-dependent hydrolase
MSVRDVVKALAATAIIGTTGCATALNYDDKSGPVFVGGRPLSRDATGEIRLVTFNLKFGEHVDRAATLLARPGPLRDADALFLQELDEPGTAALAQALGMNYVYVPSAVHPSTERDFGVAILSPWPLEDARKVVLPHEHRFRKLRRAAAAATIVAPTGAVRVYSVHLESPWGAWSSGTRRDQARAVLVDAENWSGPIAVAGDFNGRAGADELARAGFLWLTERVHRDAFLYDFDHLLVRGLCAAGGGPARKAPDDTRASDHRPVWAVTRPCDAALDVQARHAVGRPH